MENIEIEIQVKIEKSRDLRDFLEKNADFKLKKHQIDEYFSSIHRNFIDVRPIKEWLRLRNSDGKYSINYKNWHYDKEGKSNYCDEYETEIQDINEMKKILNVLNFKSIVTVDKLREVFYFDGKAVKELAPKGIPRPKGRGSSYKDYEISLDSVKGLGDFVEIEYKGKDGEVDPNVITKEMIDFLKAIDCGKIERNYVGYPFQLLFPEETKHEEQ
jgi:predicted adenylyl cyclase CyaB